MSKHKKTALLFLFLEGQIYLYPSVDFHFHATELLKQHLKINRYKIFRYFNFQLCAYHLSSAVHNATLNHFNFMRSDQLVSNSIIKVVIYSSLSQIYVFI